MEKKKLLVTASTFPRWDGDTEPRFVLDLCTHMTDDYDVTVLAPAAIGAADEEVLEGVKVIRYHYFPVHKWETLCYPGAIVPRIKEKKIRILLVPFLFISLFMKLLKILPEYDVVHAHWIIPQGIVQSFFKKPYIVTGHGGDVVSLNKGIVRKLKIRCLKRASYVTTVSEHLKSEIQKLVPDINSEIISMGVNVEKFGRQYFVPNYFGQGDKKVVLFVGRLVEIKGVQYLIEAMKNIDAILVIVGDGPLKKELEQRAEKINQQEYFDKIKFIGTKTHDELKTIYASADVFALPSVTAKDGGQEGLGLVMLEAMASGLPVVASNSGGISQVIHSRINGILVEEGKSEQIVEAVNKLLYDQELYQIIMQHGYSTSKEYDYAVLAKKYKSAVNKLFIN